MPLVGRYEHGTTGIGVSVYPVKFIQFNPFLHLFNRDLCGICLSGAINASGMTGLPAIASYAAQASRAGLPAIASYAAQASRAGVGGQSAGFDVKEAKDTKRLLRVVCDLLIMRKEVAE